MGKSLGCKKKHPRLHRITITTRIVVVGSAPGKCDALKALIAVRILISF
jgi:hypothetical protein